MKPGTAQSVSILIKIVNPYIYSCVVRPHPLYAVVNLTEFAGCFGSKRTVVFTNPMPKRSGLADIPDSSLYNESIDATGLIKEDEAL